MSKKKRRRSAWVDLVIAGLVGSMLPTAVAWRNGSFSHAEAITSQANEQTHRSEQLRLERDKLHQQSCGVALTVLGDESPNPAMTSDERRTLVLDMQRTLAGCRLAPSGVDTVPGATKALPAPTQGAPQ